MLRYTVNNNQVYHAVWPGFSIDGIFTLIHSALDFHAEPTSFVPPVPSIQQFPLCCLKRRLRF